MSRTKSTVKRSPKRAQYESEAIHQVLDNNFLAHVGFIHQNYPVVIPTMYGRDENHLYIHGASVSRLIKDLEKGIDVSISIAHVSGLVLARSAFHHSLNYESVVLFGKGQLVEGTEKLHGLKVISDHLIKGRWEEVRLPNPTELKATKVIKIVIDEASVKQRTGDPIDDKDDYALDIWAGTVPLIQTYGSPLPDKQLKAGLTVPKSVDNL